MSNQIKISTHTLGEIIVQFEMPKQFIDDINNVFDEKEATTVDSVSYTHLTLPTKRIV